MATMDDALRTFVIEARELLDQMEQALLTIEQSPDDGDTLNAIFRAAHTIKGSAGLFGIDHIVAFTHVAESVLDRVRCGEVRIASDLVALLLAVRDHLALLIDGVADGTPPEAEALAAGDRLADRLRAHLGQAPQAAAALAAPPAAEEAATGDANTGEWDISLRFGSDVLRAGMDPLAFIRYLTTFGSLEHVTTLTQSVPPLADLDPEACYLAFDIAYRTDANERTIAGAFEFVRDDAAITIRPAHGRTTAVPAGQNPAPPPAAATLPKPPQGKEQKTADSLIRVNAAKLDEHINLIGELIITSASASLIAQHAKIPELFEAAARLSRLVEEVRDSALALRMVQIGATFNKFQRVVRDVSAELGKDIRLEIAGAETELDKTVIEKIGDPLTHLLRNSMDHGIEPAELRLARGKPAHGTIRFNAYHESGNIVIEVADDGGGLDRNRILGKAVERGIVKPEQQLSDAEIHNLIFEPGFSTAEQVNNLSGRGVGMDVVQRNIMALRGTVEIESTEGVGTTMRVRLPLTLAIIDGFLVGVGSAAFVVPLEAVVECIELSAAEVAAAHGRDQLDLRGEVLPFIRLKDLFGVPDQAAHPIEADEAATAGFQASTAAEGVVLTPEGAAALAADPELAFLLNPVKRENVVVVQYGGRRAGLVVESLLGEFQTVIRPLGAVFSGIDGISGFTILGNGHVALIIDVPNLVRSVANRDRLSRDSSPVGTVLSAAAG